MNNNISSVSFGANFLKNTAVRRLVSETDNYEKFKASFVRINPKKLSDVEALESVAKDWRNEKFAGSISASARGIRVANGEGGKKIFAVTVQNSDYKKLNADKILGLVEVKEITAKDVYLSHIQVNPIYIHKKGSEYKRVGTAMLNRLKDMYCRIILNSLSDVSVQKFYERNGFRKVSDSDLKYCWENNKIFMV